MSLKSLDIVIVFKLVTLGDRPWTYSSLAKDLSVNLSVLYEGVGRALESGLIHPRTRRPHKKASKNCLSTA
ncbi:MAG: hypothetical protein ACP5VS_06595 [Desulfomonilaceae bacterium]